MPDNTSSEFSLDSIAMDDRSDPGSEPDLPTITLDHASMQVAHRREPPAAAVPNARDTGLDPTVLAATAAGARRHGEPRLGDGSYTDLTQASDVHEITPRKLAVEHSAPVRNGRRVVLVGFVLVLLGALAALVARATGVPPAVTTTWNELAPEALRPLPAKIDGWLDSALGKLPWPAADEVPLSAPMPATDEGSSSPPRPADTPSASATTPNSAPAPDNASAPADATVPDASAQSPLSPPASSEEPNEQPAPQSASVPADESSGLSTDPSPSARDGTPASAESLAKANELGAKANELGAKANDSSFNAGDPLNQNDGDNAQSASTANTAPQPPDASAHGTASSATPTPQDEAHASATPESGDGDNAPASDEPPGISPTPAATDAPDTPAPDASSTAPIRPAEPVLRPEPPLLASGVRGNEDEAVPLRVKVGRQLAGKALTLELHGVPRGATITGAKLEGAVWRAPGSQAAALALVPPKDSDKDFALSWRLIDDASGELLDTARSTVVIEARADAPTVRAKASAGDQYTPIPLELSVASNDGDGSERLSIVVSGLPSTAPLTPGRKQADGTWLLNANQLQGVIVTPGDGAPGTIELTVTAIATERNNGDKASSDAKVSFRVVPGTQ